MRIRCLCGAVAALLAPLLDAPPFYVGPLLGWHRHANGDAAPHDTPAAPLTPAEQAAWAELVVRSGPSADPA